MKNYLPQISLLLCLLFADNAIGQTAYLDSLNKVYLSLPVSERSIETCYKIALAQREVNSDSADHYFHIAIEKSAQLDQELQVDIMSDYADYLMKDKHQPLDADSIFQLCINQENEQSKRPLSLLNLYKLQGITKGLLGEIDKGQISLDKAELLISEQQFSDKVKGDFYNDFAEFYSISGELEKYTSTILTAIDYYNKIPDYEGVSIGYLNLSINHIERDLFSKAKMFGEKALDLLEKTENEFLLGHCYTILLASNSELNLPNEAERYANQALRIWQKLEIKSQEASILRNMATLYRIENKLNKAIETIDQSILLFRELGNPKQVMYSWAEKAIILAKDKNQKASQIVLDSLIKRKDIFENNAIEWMSLLKTIEKTQAENGNYKAAYTTQNELQTIKDSINNSANLLKIEELETQYFTKEKDIKLSHQKTQLSQQKYLIWLFGLLIFSLVVLAFIFWKNARYRKAVNLQLRELDNSKSRFFTNISHELRTPLTLILAPLEDALKKVRAKPIKDNLQLAHSNSKKLLTLVNEIMDLSKLESGRMGSKETNLDLEKLLRRIFYSYHSLAQLRGFILSFSYHLPKNIGVLVDAEKLERVLNNLLSNAFKYSHPGGAITLRVSDEHNERVENSANWRNRKMLKIEVNDTGKGIPSDQLEKIFDRYYQVEENNKPLQGGTGIGLAYAKEIVRFLGGDLLVESEPGKGTNFIIYLPFKKTSRIEQVEEESIDSTQQFESVAFPNWTASNNQPKILIVEDNPEMSKFLVQTLSSHFHCTTALDGNIALEKLKTQNFDLITSDVMMPNLDGFEFLKKLKSHEKQRHIPVIMLTARAMEEDKLKGFNLGIDDYLTKPFSVKELLARIHNLLKNKASREAFVNSDQNESTPPMELNFEQKQLKTAEHIVYENIDNIQFRVEDLAQQMNYSRRQIERIIKKLTGLTPAGFIREIRLQKARRLLEKRQFATIAEVRYEVGMDNASHFSKIFQDRFGVKPSEVES